MSENSEERIARLEAMINYRDRKVYEFSLSFKRTPQEIIEALKDFEPLNGSLLILEKEAAISLLVGKIERLECEIISLSTTAHDAECTTRDKKLLSARRGLFSATSRIAGLELELNQAQRKISGLYAENLKLREGKLALAVSYEREKHKKEIASLRARISSLIDRHTLAIAGFRKRIERLEGKKIKKTTRTEVTPSVEAGFKRLAKAVLG